MIFKNYYGEPIEVPHTHKVEDTQASVPMISANDTELLSSNSAVLTYYSTTLSPTIQNETVGARKVMVFSVTSSDLNGNLVLKIPTSTTLLPTKEYILVLEPIEDANTKTNIISMNFGVNSTYDFNNGVCIVEDIIRPVINYGEKISYMYKLRPQENIKSLIVYLYTITKITTSSKKLFKISLREASYENIDGASIVTTSKTGFMSAEDKNKLEKIDDMAEYIEAKLQNALFYSKQ